MPAKTRPSKYLEVCVEGEHPLVLTTGRRMKVKGSVGTWVAATEFDKKGRCRGFATGRIGSDGLKPDTWYRAKNGRLIEV